MRPTVFGSAVALAVTLFLPSPAIAQTSSFNGPFEVIDGNCTAQSHIAQGPIDADLTKRQSPFHCDAVVISMHLERGSIMFQFAEKQSKQVKIVGFAGQLTEPNLLAVERVYFEPGKPVRPNDGYCKIFYKGQNSVGTLSDIQSIACGAQVDEGDRRTVPVIVFERVAK